MYTSTLFDYASIKFRQNMNLPPSTSGKKSMNTRFLDEVEPIERKRMKLDNYNKKRWSLSEKTEEPEMLAEMGVGMLETDSSSDGNSSGSRSSQPVITNYFQRTLNGNNRKSIGKRSPFKGIGLKNICTVTDENQYDNLNVTNPSLICRDLDKFGNIENRKPNSPSTSSKTSSKGYTDSDNSNDKLSQSPMVSLTVRSPLANVSNSTEKRRTPIERIANDEFYIYRKQNRTLPPARDAFEKLSDEMVLSVFKWLPKKTLIRCSLVSRRWNRIAEDESLWTRLDLGSKSLRGGSLGRVLRRGPVILRLSQAEITDPAFLTHCVSSDPEFCTKLQYLDLSMAVASTRTLSVLFSCCRLLKKLSLENVTLDNVVCERIANNKSLEALNVSMCEGITTAGLEHLLNGCKLIQALNISWTYLSIEAVRYLVHNLPASLLRLNIAGCRKTLNDELISHVIARCPLLVELDLSDCTQLTAETVQNIERLANMEYLSLSRCYSIQASSYLRLNQYPSLLYLDIFGLMTEQAIVMLQTHLPQVGINKFLHSSVARPTVANRRTSIWGLRTRD